MSRPTIPWSNRLAAPALLLLVLVVYGHLRLAPAHAWFTGRVYVAQLSGSVSPGAGAEFRAALAVSEREVLCLGADGEAALLADNVHPDVPAAEDRLAALSREPQDDEPDGSPQIRALAVRYTLSFEGGDDLPAAYVRFALNHNMGNRVTLHGVAQECVQTLLYAGPDGELLPMPRLSLRGQGTHYYYPLPLAPGDTIEVEYRLFVPAGFGERLADGGSFLRHELIANSNNASIFHWNVVFRDGLVTPFDHSGLMNTPYVAYGLEGRPPEDWHTEQVEEEVLPSEPEDPDTQDRDEEPPEDGAEAPPQTEETGDAPSCSAEDEAVPPHGDDGAAEEAGHGEVAGTDRADNAPPDRGYTHEKAPGSCRGAFPFGGYR